MLNIGSQALAQTPLFTAFDNKPASQFEWRVVLFHKEGGLKKDWFIGQQECPINKIQFELNKKIMGAGSLEFAFLDFPIDGGDFIEVWFKGDLYYRAKIESTVDPKGGRAKLIPYHVRFQDILVNNVFTSQTIAEMLETIITETTDDTQVVWNEFFVDTGDDERFTFDYSGYETPKKIIDELVGKLDDREWGVNEDNIFTVYQPEEEVTKDLFYTYKPAYSSIDVKKEFTKVSATRYQVFKKVVGGGETERIGQVGYGSGYPILDIEDELGESRVKKFNVSEYIASDTEALEIAYDNLIAQAVVPTIINVKSVDLDVYKPKIGQKLKLQDKLEYIRRTIINCDSLTLDDTTMNGMGKWSGVTLDTTNFVTNVSSVKATLINNLDGFYYDFENIIKFFNPVKIGFMIRSSQACDCIEWSVGNSISGGWGAGAWSTGAWSVSSSVSDDLWNTVTPVSIPNGNLWYYREFTLTSSDFRFIGFRLNETLSSSIDVNIDRINLYLPHKSVYENNVVKADIVIERGGYDANMQMNQYDLFANDRDFKNQRRIEKIENIMQGV